MGQENYAIKDIEFKGNETLSDQTLLEQINTRSATLLEKMAFWKQMPEFSSVMLENDMERLHRYYQRHGFLNSRLDYALKENEKRKNMVIHIEVKERDPVKIRSVQFREPADSAVASLLKEITDDLPLKPGDRFIDREVLNFERYIRDFFYNRGYPFAEVDRDVEVHPDEELADIGFKVKPGSKAYFGEARIKGDSLVSETFIRKKLTFSEGEEYSEYKLDSTQTRLFNTDLFRYVVVRGQKDSMQNSEIPVLIEVSELPTWSLEAGVGYGTEDRFRASVNLTKLRFLGGARKLIFEGKHSYFLPISLETKLIQPEFLNDKLDLVLNPFFIRENEESYTVDRLGGGITLRQNFSTTTSGYMMYSLERDFLQDFTISEYLAREESSDLIRNKSGLTVGFFTNTTNKLIAPVSGWKLNGNFTYMGIGFRSQFHYYKSEVSLIRYIQIEDDWTAAGRIRSGFIKPLGDESSPIEDRFLLGGASSLRGWGRHQISPVNEEGKLTGGNSMLEGSLELRFPIYDIFSGVAFTDMGNVWRKAFTYNLADLRFDAGAGLRVRTPVGPVRLDIASPVFEEKKEPRFFISIGHTF
ncbi:MAG: outer membrane protein assembly factor BamA [Bacteroidota bacterium]